MTTENSRNVFDNDIGSLNVSDYFIIWNPKHNGEAIKLNWTKFDRLMKKVPQEDRNTIETLTEVSVPNVTAISHMEIR